MPTISGLNVNFYINYNGVTIPYIFVSDSTNYIAQGVGSLSDLNGNLKITAPSGVVIHDNTDFSDGGCDMPAVTLPGSSTNLHLPLMSSGVVQPGNYTILYTVYNKVTTAYYTFTRVVDFTYLKPKLNVKTNVDYDMTLFISDDQTIYTVDTIVPTINLYQHNLYYPVGSAGFGSPILTSNLIIKTSVFYPGTQSSTINVNALWAYVTTVGNIFYVLDSVVGTIDTIVSTNDLCSYYCCMKKLNDKIKKAHCHNHKDLEELLEIAAEVDYAVMLIGVARTCGHTNDIAGYLDQIKSLIGCSDDCDDCN